MKWDGFVYSFEHSNYCEHPSGTQAAYYYRDCGPQFFDIPKRRRPRCGARTRKGTPCQAPRMAGRYRCRMHGGLSTGPKTEAGRQRIAESNRRRAKRRREIQP